MASYHHNATSYGQNRPSHEILRRILGLEKVARVFGGLTQLHNLRAVAGLLYHSGDFRSIARIEAEICRFLAILTTFLVIDSNMLSCNGYDMLAEA